MPSSTARIKALRVETSIETHTQCVILLVVACLCSCVRSVKISFVWFGKKKKKRRSDVMVLFY